MYVNIVDQDLCERKLSQFICVNLREDSYNEKRNVFNLEFLEGLEDLMNHPTNDERYDKETCQNCISQQKAGSTVRLHINI